MKTLNRHFKDAIYEQFARIGKAVSSSKRLELLDLLCQGERTVEILAKEAGISTANTSQHLQVLRAAHLIESEKRGQFVIYRLTDQAVCDFFLSMRVLAERELAEVGQIKRRFLEGKGELEPINRETLIQRVKEEKVIVMDVRPVEEFLAGHIQGAISIPLEELEQRLSELPRDQEIVAYCRGPYCVLAIRAVEILREKGFHAFRMEDGVQDWRARGFPISIGES